MDEKKSIGAVFVSFATVCFFIPDVIPETIVVACSWTALTLALGGPRGDAR